MNLPFVKGNCFLNLFFVFTAHKIEEKQLYSHNIYAQKTLYIDGRKRCSRNAYDASVL